MIFRSLETLTNKRVYSHTLHISYSHLHRELFETFSIQNDSGSELKTKFSTLDFSKEENNDINDDDIIGDVNNIKYTCREET